MPSMPLSPHEARIFRKLDAPRKIQDFLNGLRTNEGPGSDTLRSPRGVLRAEAAHCMEGALLAAAILWYHGHRPLLLDLRSAAGDDDHVVALYRKGKHWGAISKTNHAVLRYRDPVYRSVRELAMSYFHEYFLNADGQKTLRDFSRPFPLRRFGTSWIVAEGDLWHIAEDLDASPHAPFAPRGAKLRPADRIERKAGALVEWKGGRRML